MEKCSLVVDIGSTCCKVGWSGENFPSIRIPSVVGYLPVSESSSDPSCIRMNVVIGSKSLPMIRDMPTDFFISRGSIINWDAMEVMWNQIFLDFCTKPTEQDLLITGLLPSDRYIQEKVTEIMMETFHVPSLHIGNQAELALFGSGLLTGMVLECGAGLTHIAAILGGQVIPHCTIISELAGLDISSLLYKSLINRDEEMKHLVHREAMEDLKEKFCYVSKNPDQKKSSSDLTSMQRWTSVLPDGMTVSLTEEHFTYPDVLFKPSQFSLAGEELKDKIVRSALACGWNFKSILSHVVLSGGSTLFQGFPERLFQELRRSRHGSWPSDVISQPNRIYLPWIGGSMLCCLSNFKSYCITREKYNEVGVAALQ